MGKYRLFSIQVTPFSIRHCEMAIPEKQCHNLEKQYRRSLTALADSPEKNHCFLILIIRFISSNRYRF